MKLAVNSRNTDKKYKNKDIAYDKFRGRLMNPVRTTETVKEYPKLPKAQRDALKDHGGFVGGHLKNGSRKKGNVLCRSMGALDADHIPQGEDFIQRVKTVLPGIQFILYSTHSHTPEHPRYRLLLIFSREVSEEEYAPLMRMVAKDIGMDYFDDTTYQANRMMYWPSCPSDGEYVFEEQEGTLLDVDDYLGRYEDWHDVTQWPTSSRQSEVIKRSAKEQADPLQKDGIVGAFCRTYSIQEAIGKFLPQVYAPSAVEGRYDYIPGEGTAGVVVYDDKFVYSHHDTDPASGRLLNAYDLVRVHKFGDDDPKKSFDAMAEFAVQDEKVAKLLLEERRQAAALDFADGDWEQGLVRDKHGEIVNSLHNIILIIECDPKLNGIVYNELADSIEVSGEVPWERPDVFWRDADDAQLVAYVDAQYGSFSARNIDVALTKVADDRSYHPIREFFDALPDWDRVPRVDTLLIEYLGAADNAYTRAVIRKTLCAAYKRIQEPGCKFDYMLVLNGAQGIGKSTFIANLGMKWFSDSLTLSDMNDKTAAEKLQGYWILEIGELAGMKKADLDKVKAFISRVDDKYRASYGRRVASHPRQCVFFGTTNSENGYLRDITGNRRYWNIQVSGESPRKPWEMTPETVQQIWAEVRILVEAGEKLYLPPELEGFARQEQRNAMEQDDREGLVHLYLDRPLPENWKDMDFFQRRSFLDGDMLAAQGTERRTIVSNMEIWCECFGRKKEDLRPADSYAIAAIMSRFSEWQRQPKPQRIPIYGLQRVYKRL